MGQFFEENCEFSDDEYPDIGSELWQISNSELYTPRITIIDSEEEYDKVNIAINYDPFEPRQRTPKSCETKPREKEDFPVASTSAPFGTRYVFREHILHYEVPEFIRFVNEQYHCYFAGCHYKCYSTCEWKTHENVHLGIYEFACSRCEFEASSQEIMDAHVQGTHLAVGGLCERKGSKRKYSA